QGERSLSAKNAFKRYVDVTLVQTASVEVVVHELEAGDVDLLLCSSSDIALDELEVFRVRNPDIPVILLASEHERQRLLGDPNLTAWDVIVPAKMDRLPLSAIRAVQSQRE